MTNKNSQTQQAQASAPPTRQSLALQKRDQILKGAKLVFMDNGFDGASVDQIALTAGVSKATVYKHFPGKEELFIALIEDKCEQMRSRVFNFDNLVGPPTKILNSLGVNFVKNVLRDEEMHFFRIVMAHSYKLPSIGRAFNAAGPNLGSQLLSKYLQKLCNEGVVKIPDTLLAAHQFIAMCSAGLVERAHLEHHLPSDQTIRAQVKSATALFLKGYA